MARPTARTSGSTNRERSASWLQGDPRDVREFLVREDPLDLHACGTNYLYEEAFLIDDDRFFMRSATVLAMRHAGAAQLPTDEEVWSVMDGAAQQIIDVDRILAESGREVERDDPRYLFLTEIFYVRSGHGHRASWAFNRLPKRTRFGSLELFFQRSTLEDCVEKGIAKSPEELLCMGRAALDALMRTFPDSEPMFEPFEVPS